MSELGSILTADRAAAVLGDRHRVVDALADVERSARHAVDPFILGLCERRVGQMLGVAPDRLPELPAPRPGWVDSEAEAAIVAFVEQWVIDVASMPDNLVDSVCESLGQDRLLDFVHGLLMVEQRTRLALAWERLEVEPT